MTADPKIPIASETLNGRGEIEPEKCIVCVLDYPIEKENPEVDWTPMLRLLTSPGLRRFHVMETIRTMGRKPANEKGQRSGANHERRST